MVSAKTPQELINKIVYTSFPYFDIHSKKKKYKSRPVLIIGAEKKKFECDLTMLPISSVSKKEHLNSNFDINIGLKECPDLKCITQDECYVRTHKQSTVHSKDIITSKKFDDLEVEYSEKIVGIKEKLQEFNRTLF